MYNSPLIDTVGILEDNGFAIEETNGSQSHYRSIKREVREEHRALFDALCKFHPEEMVAAFVAPVYPDSATQVTLECRKSSKGVASVST